MLEDNNYNGIRKRIGWSGHDRPGEISGLEHRVDMISWDEYGELRGRNRKTDPDNWILPPSLHPVALTGLGGGTGTLPGAGDHSVRGPKHRHRRPEPN